VSQIPSRGSAHVKFTDPRFNAECWECREATANFRIRHRYDAIAKVNGRPCDLCIGGFDHEHGVFCNKADHKAKAGSAAVEEPVIVTQASATTSLASSPAEPTIDGSTIPGYKPCPEDGYEYHPSCGGCSWNFDLVKRWLREQEPAKSSANLSLDELMHRHSDPTYAAKCRAEEVTYAAEQAEIRGGFDYIYEGLESLANEVRDGFERLNCAIEK